MGVATKVARDDTRELCAPSVCAGRVGLDGVTSLSDQEVEGMDYLPRIVVAEVPQKIMDMEYAVRGAIVQKAAQIDAFIKGHPEQQVYPFKSLVYCNIGNPQNVGQKPLTYLRQLSSVMVNPALLSDISSPSWIPSDIRTRATEWLTSINSTGAYSHSQGAPKLRSVIAEFLKQRDGYGCTLDSIFMTDGASTAVKMLLSTMIDGKKDAILMPNPQYPLYGALVTSFGGTAVEYLVDPEKNWTVSLRNVQKSIEECRRLGSTPKVMVIINPGNPAGNVFPQEALADMIRMCEKENLAIIADEVYQDNVYGTKKFVSIRKLILSMGSPVQVASLHSASKGFYGECGQRGGFMQLENVGAEYLQLLYKVASVGLCSNILGQVNIAAICSPPKPGFESYKLYAEERHSILTACESKARLVRDLLNDIPGFVCQPIDGALYAFPSVQIPRKACDLAAAQNMQPDMFYCTKLLEATGLVVVPGTGFGVHNSCSTTKGDTCKFHFRLTILPSAATLEKVLKSAKQFHLKFLQEFS